MIRRILIVGGIGLALVLGARLALAELTERAWEKRRAELLELAIFPPDARRPWEVKLEALQERTKSSQRFDEIVDSSHRPHVAWGSGEPRFLDEFEKVWVEAMWNELLGLEAILAELRSLPLEDLEWHGTTAKLFFLREAVNVLCARAWLDVERGDGVAAARSYADALRLAEASDDGTSLGTLVRYTCQAQIALRSGRSALDLGLSARELRTALAPLIERWAYAPASGERVVRRELSFLAEAAQRGEPDDPGELLAYCAPMEAALALAGRPAADTPWARGEPVVRERDVSLLDNWTFGVRQMHALHAQRNVVLTALAVAAYREEHGEWPATLSAIDDLPFEHTLDTLTGAPLPYHLDASGARIGPATWGERVDPWQGEGDSPYLWNLR